MSLVVDRYGLGPLQTNCYVVRTARGAAEAAVIDPGGDAADLRLELARSGAACAAILITHGRFDHLGGVADLAEGTGAPVYMPEGERALLERYAEFAPLGAPGRPYTPDHLLEGGETVDVAGIAFECVSVPGHSPAHVAFHADGCLFSGDLLFAGSVGRVDLPEPTGTRCSPPCARSPTATRPRRSSTPVTGRRPRSATSSRATRSSRSCGRDAHRGAARHPRRPPADQPLWQKVTGEMERLCALYGYRRIQTPVFEDTELFARTSGSGSDIVQKEMYTFEDRGGRSLTLRPEGTAPICRAYIEHGMKQLRSR